MLFNFICFVGVVFIFVRVVELGLVVFSIRWPDRMRAIVLLHIAVCVNGHIESFMGLLRMQQQRQQKQSTKNNNRDSEKPSASENNRKFVCLCING